MKIHEILAIQLDNAGWRNLPSSFFIKLGDDVVLGIKVLSSIISEIKED